MLAYIAGPLKLRASYGTGAKTPRFDQLFDPFQGNPDLKATTHRQTSLAKPLGSLGRLEDIALHFAAWQDRDKQLLGHARMVISLKIMA